MKKTAIILAVLAFGACGDEVTDNTNTKQANRPEVKTFNTQPLDKDGKPIPGIPDPERGEYFEREAWSNPDAWYSSS